MEDVYNVFISTNRYAQTIVFQVNARDVEFESKHGGWTASWSAGLQMKTKWKYYYYCLSSGDTTASREKV